MTPAKIKIGPKNIAQVARLLSSNQRPNAVTSDTVGRVIATLISSDPDTKKDDLDGLLSLLSPRARNATEAVLGLKAVTPTSSNIVERLGFSEGWLFIANNPAALVKEEGHRLIEKIPGLSESDLDFISQCDAKEFKAVQGFFSNLSHDYQFGGSARTKKSNVIYEMITEVGNKIRAQYPQLDDSVLEGLTSLACKACGL